MQGENFSVFSLKLVHFFAYPLSFLESRFHISDFGKSVESFLLLDPYIKLLPSPMFLPS